MLPPSRLAAPRRAPACRGAADAPSISARGGSDRGCLGPRRACLRRVGTEVSRGRMRNFVHVCQGAVAVDVCGPAQL